MPTKILAIDDSKTMRLAIKITFAAEDCEVVAVSKGSEAVVRAKQMPADILIVDAVLAAGEPSGYEVARMLRADPETAHIPVLILVSNQTGIDEAQVQASGANGALTKPFDTQELLERVNALVSGKSVATKSTAPGKPVSGRRDLLGHGQHLGARAEGRARRRRSGPAGARRLPDRRSPRRKRRGLEARAHLAGPAGRLLA
jgi:DNA-binding response OmpR family regulator